MPCAKLPNIEETCAHRDQIIDQGCYTKQSECIASVIRSNNLSFADVGSIDPWSSLSLSKFSYCEVEHRGIEPVSISRVQGYINSPRSMQSKADGFFTIVNVNSQMKVEWLLTCLV
eukprot:scaffold1060_cov385-Pavlova_lutheri.AAC.16